MATLNSSNKNGLSTDVYDIAEYVNKVKQEFTPNVDEDTLMLGIFGYFGMNMSDMFQNSIIMAGEFANESIPTKAKFDKNVISHALNLGITSLNANPAKMEVLLIFIEDEIIKAIGGGSGDFVFDCNNKIYFDTMEFHPDYDIRIKRIKLKNGSYTYTAQYDMTGEGIYDNPLSDITNPYLTPPVVMQVNGTNYLFTSCIIRQVEKTTIYKKVLSDNTISSKTVNFEFDSQLAAFDVNVSNSSGNTHLVPVYEGLTSNSKYPYVWYTYLDSSTIRVKFDRDSYAPRVNSDVEITLQTTQGEAGNFTWAADDPIFSFDSDRLKYSNITVMVRPLTGGSKYGTNKKSIDDLRRIIPKESLSRGSISTTTDLNNFFNAIDTDNSQMYLYKKRDNAREMLYYSYIVMKDAMANVIPTNTINLMINPDQLFTDDSKSRLILKKGQIIKLNTDKTTGYIVDSIDPNDFSDSFYYVIPYNFAICTNPMYGMYFLTTMDETRSLNFSYINDECMYQYVATAIDWKRNYIEDDDTYKLTIDIEQNITDDDSMVAIDEDGNIVDASKLRCFVVFYDEENIPYRYTEGTMTAYDSKNKIAGFEFSMSSSDYIDSYNRIRINGLTTIGLEPGILDYGYMASNCKAMIHIVTKQPDYSTRLTYTDIFSSKVDLSTIIPGLDGYCVSNSYGVNGGIDFFYDYSEIIYSTVSVNQGTFDPDSETVAISDGSVYHYMVENVPVLKNGYFRNEDMVQYFCSELIRRKNYIDEALQTIEDPFGINFKFVNTYGPSRLFTLDNADSYINRVNLSLTFRIGLQVNYDENIITYIKDDIKEFIEDINDISSIHMSNLITEITMKYSDSITFFEFVDMNGYGTSEQHLFAMKMPDNVITPELINISTNDDFSPDINIIIA